VSTIITNNNNNNQNVKFHNKIKMNVQKRSRKKEIIRRISCLNKFENSLLNNNNGLCHNKSIDLNFNLNKSNHIISTNDFYYKENIDKGKILKTLNNNCVNYTNKNTNISTNNVRRITTNNLMYNRTKNLKERNSSKITLTNDLLAQSQIYQHSYHSTLNNNKRNININNNIIININNSSNCDTLDKTENKSKSKSKSKSKTKSTNKNSKPKSKPKSKTKVIKIEDDDNNKNNFNPEEKEIKKLDMNLSFADLGIKNYIKIEHITNSQIPKEYLNVIYHNLLQEEKNGIIPKPIYNYMNDQNEINEQMRSILIDWIIDVHYKFGFTDETLFMTVLIIDRYATIRQISRTKLQLLGITAFMIACKHEEIDLPKIDDFLYITDNAYTKEEMIKMENDILGGLNFSLLYPSPIKFFEYLSVNFNFSKKLHFMGKYLMETFLIDIKYIKYKPSVISCACAYIVMKFFKLGDYQESYNKKFYMLNENEDLPLGHGVKDCAQDICILVDNIDNSNYLACLKKYSKEEFEKVALIIENK